VAFHLSSPQEPTALRGGGRSDLTAAQTRYTVCLVPTQNSVSNDDYIAIVDLAYRYARALDNQDWDTVAACFTEDAVAEFTTFSQPLRGRDEIVRSMRDGRQRYDATQHVTATPQISVDGDVAKASFYVIAQHVVKQNGATETCLLGVDYDDELLRTGDGWLLRHRKVRRLWAMGNESIVGPVYDS
jgi:ketosteroid isomerase-like protein